jgi:murein DD-endopeptidase MepM/ murein hydrolase activator NlpD
MFKKIIIAISILTLSLAQFNQLPIVEALNSTNLQPIITSIPDSLTQSSPVIKRAITPKIVNGELDLEYDIKITGTEKQNFDKCKQDEKLTRSNRNKNKPTACLKQPKLVNDEFTDQVYTTLFDRIQDKKDVDDNKDMNTELNLSSFLDVKNIPICNELGFNDNIKTLSKLNLDLSTRINTCSSTSTSNSLSSSSNSQSNAVSSLTTSNIINYSTLSSKANTQSTTNSTSSTKTSFLDFLFGSVKADAAGVDSWDYRLPYETGSKIMTMRNFNDGTDTHTNHNAIDFYAVDANNIKFDYAHQPNIVAAKGGTIVESISKNDSLGSHIVIKQDDGKYAIYAHLSIRSKSVNDVVKRGEKIGVQGDTGTHLNYDNNSHLHFEVLDPSILNYTGGSITSNGLTAWSTCQSGWDVGFCYFVFTLDQYKVKPIYDECFISKGGTQNNETNCKYNGSNVGYPWIAQSSPAYWTSINTTFTAPTVFNNNPGTIDLSGGYNPNWSFDVQGYGIVNSNGTYDQTPVNMVSRSGTANNAQKWQYYPATKEIKGMNDMCLDPGFANEGDFLRVQKCSAGTNQKWNFNSNKTISNDYQNRCIMYEDVTGQSYKALKMRSCTASGWQVWNPTGINLTPPAPTVYNNYSGTIDLKGGYVPSWSLDVMNYGVVNSSGNYNQTPVNMVSRSGNANNAQKWQYFPSSKEIKGMNDLCLDSGNGNDGDFARVNSCTGGSNQKWNFNTSNGTISNDQGGRCLMYEDVGQSYKSVKMRSCTGSGWQIWTPNGLNITVTPPPAPTPPSIFNNYSGYIMLFGLPTENWSFDVLNYGTVAGNNTFDGSRVQMYKRNSDPINNAQKWKYTWPAKEIRGMSDYCLDSGNGNEGDYLRLNTCNGSSNQKWTFNNSGQITVDSTGRCVQYETITGSRSWNLVVRNCNSQGNQKWIWAGL